MCGIAGYVGPSTPEHLAAMLRALAHRGRDDSGSHVEPDGLLVMTDRMSPASSLDLRLPSCDHRLVEENLNIAPRMEIPGFRLKGLLKAAFADVPPWNTLTHRKQGFMIPLARWLRTDLRHVMEDRLAPDRVRWWELFGPAALETLMGEHLWGSRSHADHPWTLMMLELWMREYLDGHAPWNLVE